MGIRKVFEGIKVLEIGSGFAGPIASRYLADHGATVVRLESKARPDHVRLLPPYKDNNSPNPDAALFFSCVNPNKLSVTINLNYPKGVELVKRLVKWADIVNENYSPGALKKFGLCYEEFQKTKPDLIMISSCLQGQTGPHKDFTGFGGQGAALSGFNYWAGWPDGEPIGPAAVITDYLCPRMAASAIIGALLYRKRTGKGMYLDLSQIEAAVVALSYPLLEYTANGRVMPRLGNCSMSAAPHNVFPCKGVDRWVAITVNSDDEWLRLRKVMGNPEWATASELDGVSGRLEHQDKLEEGISLWTRNYTPHQVMETCQKAGVRAGAVQDMADLARDPQHASRGTFTTLDHPVIGPHPYYNVGFILSKAPRALDTPSPLMGQHNSMVLRDILGISDDDIAQLKAEEVLS